MAHTPNSNLVVTVEMNGKPIAVFVCIDEGELEKLNQAESMKPPVLVNVRNLRLFVGNAVIIPMEG